MKRISTKIVAVSLIIALLFLCRLPVLSQGQANAHKWRRVFTGDGFTIDVDPESLSFEAEHVVRAIFKTTLSQLATLPGTKGLKYKTRIESIEFKSRNLPGSLLRQRPGPNHAESTEKLYRVHETSLLDSNGSPVRSWTNASDELLVLKAGGVMDRLLLATRQLPPLGTWKVSSYRYADDSGGASESPELNKLVGIQVRLDLESAEVGPKKCPAPVYQSRTLTEKEFLREIGTSPGSLGLSNGVVDTIVVKCERNGWEPPRSLLIRLQLDDEMLMLWEGVFLVLKKQD